MNLPDEAVIRTKTLVIFVDARNAQVMIACKPRVPEAMLGPVVLSLEEFEAILRALMKAQTKEAT
jgi:hypothetical protein